MEGGEREEGVMKGRFNVTMKEMDERKNRRRDERKNRQMSEPTDTIPTLNWLK